MRDPSLSVCSSGACLSTGCLVRVTLSHIVDVPEEVGSFA